MPIEDVIQNGNLDIDLSKVFVDAIVKDNKFLETGRVYEVSILFLMIENEMRDLIDQHMKILMKTNQG